MTDRAALADEIERLVVDAVDDVEKRDGIRELLVRLRAPVQTQGEADAVYTACVERQRQAVLDRPLVPIIDSAPTPTGQSEGGWRLVPPDITLEMQRAYFDVIDRNMDRVQTDARFGRFDGNKQAYRAMIAAAPPSPIPSSDAEGEQQK